MCIPRVIHFGSSKYAVRMILECPWLEPWSWTLPNLIHVCSWSNNFIQALDAHFSSPKTSTPFIASCAAMEEPCPPKPTTITSRTRRVLLMRWLFINNASPTLTAKRSGPKARFTVFSILTECYEAPGDCLPQRNSVERNEIPIEDPMIIQKQRPPLTI